MAGTSSTKAIKYSLLAFNGLTFIGGLIMLIAGSVIQGQINSQKLAHSIGGYSTQSGTIICILFGIAVMLMSLFGLYATVKDHHRFLYFYSFIMALIFVVQFVTGVTGLAVKNSSSYTQYVSNIFEPEFNTTLKPQTEERDFYQHMFKCCGWQSASETYKNGSGVVAPASCCKTQFAAECVKLVNVTDETWLWKEGCKTPLIEAFRFVIDVACSILVVFSFFNIVTIVLSVVLGKKIKSGYQYT